MKIFYPAPKVEAAWNEVMELYGTLGTAESDNQLQSLERTLIVKRKNSQGSKVDEPRKE